MQNISIEAAKAKGFISGYRVGRIILACSIFSVVRCSSNTALFNISSYSSEVPRVYKSRSIHSCFKFFLLIILFSVIMVSLPLFFSICFYASKKSRVNFSTTIITFPSFTLLAALRASVVVS